MSGKINKYNAEIFKQIEAIEKKEKDGDYAKNISMVAAVTGINISDD